MNRAEVTKVLTEELSLLAQRIKQNHIRAGQVASGRTLRSITYEVNDNVGTLYGRFPFGTLETGRKAGRIPRNLDAIIYQWAKAKGIHPEPMPYVRQPSDRWRPKYSSAEERAMWAFSKAVARKIQREGTLLHREGGRADIYSNEIPDAIESIEKRITAIFETIVQSIHINQAKAE